ncbi:unnamed protein product [Chilo suppressalis]|uniref:Innexin n=1 Tax=Chilo suppressalis TaxID=168631 RepID=A0ABN8BFU1_CHISP|nr:unnamed protein product [Chilo suppressalis]
MSSSKELPKGKPEVKTASPAGKLFTSIRELSSHLKFSYSKPTIDNLVFKLHYKVTVAILLASMFLVCAREYFGSNIECTSDKGVPDKVIKTYCFFVGTLTIVRHYNESLLQSGFLPHPGVGPISETDQVSHHKYYLWVPFVLVFQSICFYIPHYYWKLNEGGRIKALVDGLQYSALALGDNDMKLGEREVPSKMTLDKKINLIKEDIILRLRLSRTWSTWLVAMEVVNLLNVTFQIWLINEFLNGHFYDLGLKVLEFRNWNNIADPLETVFPKVTKCIFHKYGPSGSIQQHDALCVMALNIIHEKIYTTLWFWLLFLFTASLLAVIWRAVSFFLYRRSYRFSFMGFHSAGNLGFNNVIRVIHGTQFADWLFLNYLGNNMKSVVFEQLFTALAEELGNKELMLDYQGREQKGAEPVLVGHVYFDDETLPLQQDKKDS